MNNIYVTSKQACKVNAVRKASMHRKVISLESKSSVPEQPMGRKQILEGAKNRMKGLHQYPIFSIETGLVNDQDISVILLKTRYGTFQTWTAKAVHDKERLLKWKMKNTQDVTVGTIEVEYEKEHGSDKLCIGIGSIEKGSHVVVIDDLVATGGTLNAAKELIHLSQAKYVACLSPFVTTDKDGFPQCKDDRLRFAYTTEEAKKGLPLNKMLNYADSNELVIASPSSYNMVPPEEEIAEIKWNSFCYSSRIELPLHQFENRDVKVYMDPSKPKEFLDVLQVLKILYRKHPNKVTVNIPFLEQATQDRIEFSDTHESLALVDTLSKLLGDVYVETVDLHAEQSRLIFHDLFFRSGVNKLFELFIEEYPDCVPVFPDDGACKRYVNSLNVTEYVTFRKVRKGDQRIVKTDDQIHGKEYVIIDDLVRSGGTIKAVHDHLRINGAVSVYGLFAHAAVEHKTAQNLSRLDDIWTTNTCGYRVPHEWVKLRCC